MKIDKKLYNSICRKAFHIPPFQAKLQFKKLKELLASVDFWEYPDHISHLIIKVHKSLRSSNCLVAQCLIHEIAHLVSGQRKHNNKFYSVYFRAAQTKFGRKFF
jgi:hypothetical protein